MDDFLMNILIILLNLFMLFLGKCVCGMFSVVMILIWLGLINLILWVNLLKCVVSFSVVGWLCIF